MEVKYKLTIQQIQRQTQSIIASDVSWWSTYKLRICLLSLTASDWLGLTLVYSFEATIILSTYTKTVLEKKIVKLFKIWNFVSNCIIYKYKSANATFIKEWMEFKPFKKTITLDKKAQNLENITGLKFDLLHI